MEIQLIDKNTLEIDTAVAMGRIMILEGEVIVKGTFEQKIYVEGDIAVDIVGVLI